LRIPWVEKYEKMANIAKRFLGHDPRITFEVMDAEVFITVQQEQSFDLIFADASAGKFHLLAETLRLPKVGASPGRHASDAWCAIMSGFLLLWLACT